MNTFLTLTLFLAGCTQKHNEEPKQTPKKLTLNLQEGDPPSLNPYVGVDLRSRCLFLTLYEPLMRRGADGKLEFAAAKSVDIDPTQTIYTFHIRPHTWSNGEPVTAYHFEQAWKFALNPKSPSVRTDLFYPIINAKAAKMGLLPLEAVAISAPDPQTLIVELEHPTPYFLELTASSFFLPLYHPNADDPLFYNGPYVAASHLPDEKLVFKKNPLYWDQESVEIEELDFLMVRDPMTALALFEKGELDLVGDPFSTIPFDVLPTLLQSDELEAKTVSRIFYLLINTEHFPLNNKYIRKALSLSLNRDLFTEHLFFGQEKTLSLLPSPLSLLEPGDLAPLPTAEECRALFEQGLKELGLTHETFPSITLSYAELSGQKKMAEFVQESWKETLGIEAKIKCSEWNVHSVDLRRKNYEIGALHLTTLYQDPMFYFDLFRDKKNASNYCSWENPLFKDYLERSEHALSAQDRSFLLRQAELLLIEEMPAIPIFTHNFQYLKQKDVDLCLTDLGIYDFKHARRT